MHYSLTSRFRGTILGLAIGARQQQFGSHKRYLSYPNVNLSLSLAQNPETEDRIVSLAAAGMKSLIQSRQFDVEDWHRAVGNSSLSGLDAIAATIPLALFYHENEIKLRDNLQIAVAVGQPEIQDIALAVGYAIALSLQAKLDSVRLLNQTINFVGDKTTLAQKLFQVKNFLEENAGLETVVTNLKQDSQLSSEIALAFYCYLSSLSDFRLTVRRVVETRTQPQLIGAITAALSGAYNGYAGIPPSWRQQLCRPTPQPGCATSMTSEKEMLKLCDALVAVWSGVYDLVIPTDLSQIAAIAAPRTIRTR